MTAGRKINTMTQNWCTPHKYVNAIKRFWNGRIGLDPCSNEHSIVGADTEFRLPYVDGLEAEWNYDTIFVNPPYGRDTERGTTIKDWFRKANDANKNNGSEVIMLVPVATNSSHWKEYVFGKADCICFLYDTRLRFMLDGEEYTKGAPMACCLIYYGKDSERFKRVFSEFGAVLKVR